MNMDKWWPLETDPRISPEEQKEQADELKVLMKNTLKAYHDFYGRSDENSNRG